MHRLPRHMCEDSSDLLRVGDMRCRVKACSGDSLHHFVDNLLRHIIYLGGGPVDWKFR